MFLYGKRLNELNEGDLQALIDNQVWEKHDLEYKKRMYGRSDEEIREMLRDITSIANAYGGHLIIGVREDDANEGIPIEILGVDRAEEETSRIISSCLSNVDERILGLETRIVPLSDGRSVIIIRIPRSLRSPHMITFKGLNQIWIRHDRQKSKMSMAEIKEACSKVESLRQKLDDFLHFREQEILEEMEYQPCYVVASTPLLVKDEILDIFDPRIRGMIKNPYNQRSESWIKCGDEVRTTLYGLISETPRCCRLEVFRNGHIEFRFWIMRNMLIEGERVVGGTRYPIFNSVALIGCLVSFIRFIRKLYSYIGLIEPIVVSVCFYNISNYGLYKSSKQMRKMDSIGPPMGFNVWSKRHLKIPPSQVGYFNDKDQVARKFADRIWNAFGYDKAPPF